MLSHCYKRIGSIHQTKHFLLMKYNLLCLITTLITFTTTSQNHETLYLWDDKYPGVSEEYKVSVMEAHVERKTQYIYKVSCPCITVYEPQESKRNGAALLVCPGGGFKLLAIDLEGSEIAEWLNTLGYTAFVLEYSVPNNKEQAIYDGQRAMRTIRHNASKWDIDPHKVGLIGFSAGGSLGGVLSACADSATYISRDVIDKQSFRPDFSLLIYSSGIVSKNKHGKFIPALNEKTPPVFLFRTQDDNPKGTIQTASMLIENGTPVELHILPEGKHGYGLRTSKAAAAADFWPKAAERWLNETIGW